MTRRTAQIPAATIARPAQFQFPFTSPSRLAADALLDPRPVTVIAIVKFHNHVKMYRVEGKPSRVLVDYRRAGYFDRLGTMEFQRKPHLVRGVMVLLSDGQQVFVHEQELVVIKAWRRRNPGEKTRRYPEKVTVFTREANLRRGTLTYDVAAGVKIDDVVTQEFPFQWVHDKKRGLVLTNGVEVFPTTRPQKEEWANYPIDAVPAHLWDAFLDGLHGKFFKDLVPHAKAVRTEPLTKRGPRITPAQERVLRQVNGYMWKGNGGEQVELGRNIVFIVPRDKKSTVYVVDGIGAAYLFGTIEEARTFASGAVRRTKALKDGAKRIVHAGDWESRLVKAVVDF